MSQRLKNDFILVPEIDIHTSDMSKIPDYIKRLEGLRQSWFDDDNTISRRLNMNGNQQEILDYEYMFRSEVSFLDNVINFLEKRLNRTSSPTSRSPSAPADPWT
jgi:hypothetical protein